MSSPANPIAPEPARAAAAQESSKPGASLGRLAARGALWTISGYGISQVLRLASNLVLTRIFPTEVFGLMALITAFLTGLTLFSDVGIKPSIIQSKRGDDPAFLNTAWTIQAGRGVALWLASCLLAWPASVFFEVPELKHFLPVAGLGTLIMGLFSTNLVTMNRQLNLSRLTLIDLSTQVVSLTVTVTLAVVSRSVWALVFGGLVSNVVKLLLSHFALPGIKNRPFWEKDAARALFSFGRWIFVATLLAFLVGQADRLVFGKLVPLSLLGVYSIGSMVAQMPVLALGQLCNQVTFALYSRTLQKGEHLGKVFRRARYAILLIAGWAASGLIAGGPTLIRIMYDHRYDDAGWIVQILSVGGFFAVIDAINSAALLSLGQASWNVYGRISMILGMALAIPTGFFIFGFPGAVAGYATAELFRFSVSAFAITREKLPAWSQDLKIVATIAVSAFAGWKAVHAVEPLQLHISIHAAVVFFVVSAFWIPLGLPVLVELRRSRASRAV